MKHQKEKDDELVSDKPQREENSKPEEEKDLPIKYATHGRSILKSARLHGNDENADKYSVDSLDILETPTSDSGISGGTNSLERDFSKNNSTMSVENSLKVTEEITIDQSEVMYIAPGGPKPDVDEMNHTNKTVSFIDEVNEIVAKSSSDISTKETVDSDDQNQQIKANSVSLDKPNSSPDVRSSVKKEEMIKSHPLSSHTASEHKSNEEDSDLNKLLSYVESAKRKSGEVDGPASPGAESKKNNASFFVDVSEKKPISSGLGQRSLDSFGAYQIGQHFDSDGRQDKPKATITALEYRAERPAKGTGSFTMRDSAHKPVSSLREAYGKPLNREADTNVIKTSISANRTPTYSFYRTVETKTDTSRKNKEQSDINKRHSTIIMTSRGDDKAKVVSQKRRSDYYMGPRPWGSSNARQTSEPSVRDVRKALAINEQKRLADDRSSPLSMEVEGINSSAAVNDGDGVREQISKIGFEPHSEQEPDSALEEKSIALLNLPAERKTLKIAKQPYQSRMSSFNSEKLSGSMENISNNNIETHGPTNNMVKSTDNVFELTLSGKEKSKKTLQSQYVELQQQFSKWQEQLMDNQALLSKRADNATKSKGSSEFDRRRTVDVLAKEEPAPNTQAVVTNAGNNCCDCVTFWGHERVSLVHT